MSITTLPNDDKARLARVGLTGPDAPLPLSDACEIYFSGRISVATLKAEQKRGNLEIYKIGRQYFTSFNQIKVMMEKCRLPSESRRANAHERLTEEAKARVALASALLTAKKLRAARRKKVE
ncbi:hypothetical protein [Bradyrhizobium erythrophlei]|uniref:Uncharacterized protein n=1 Tax=Bradyrhizobium erythrophlei TaxID=1437360 RepID=A0A1M5M8K4_9BRAD|nr:hypothetical protein [Bradyrhizobium erythrophlei]SHG73143.1 hypothetical protein SAMN05444169_3863 [Bradyrhizobium erythrophlei]